VSRRDPFEELEREVERLFRRLRALEQAVYGELGLPGVWPENMTYRVLREVAGGILEPMVEVYELGDEIVMVVDMPGVRPETVEVQVYEDRVVVRAEADEKLVEEAFGGRWMVRRTARYEGEFSLPARIDPDSVRLEWRGSALLIRARRA